MSARLIVQAGPDRGREFTLVAGQTLQIGRSQATATKLTDPAVSRVHCEIEYDGLKAVLINISSSATLVNGRPAGQQDLRPGDVLRLGDTEIRFQGPEADDSVAGLVGQTFAHYAVEDVVTQGNSSVIFRASDTRDGRAVALKVLRPDFASDEEEMQRFVRAMKTMLPIRHPNLVTILAAGKTGPHCWVAMEFVEGENLTDVIRKIGLPVAGGGGALEWWRSYRVAVQVGRALEYAHGQSILHRNVTPRNIFLRKRDKQAVLGDLMLAKALEGVLARQITRPGQVLGDVSYLPPERTHGGASDERSDLYGLGATLYALLTGRPPFQADTTAEVIQKIRREEPEKPQKYQTDIPDAFQNVVLKLLAKEPAQRFASARELLAELERIGQVTGTSA